MAVLAIGAGFFGWWIERSSKDGEDEEKDSSKKKTGGK